MFVMSMNNAQRLFIGIEDVFQRSRSFAHPILLPERVKETIILRLPTCAENFGELSYALRTLVV